MTCYRALDLKTPAARSWQSGPELSAADAQRWKLRLTEYDRTLILESMRVGDRGQVTIPKEIRDQFGLGPEAEVEFRVVDGNIVLKKAPRKLNLTTSAKPGYSSVDEFIDDVRGR